MNASVKDWEGKSTRSKILSIRPDDRSKILPCHPPPGVGSEKRKSANVGNGKGERTQLTNEK